MGSCLSELKEVHVKKKNQVKRKFQTYRISCHEIVDLKIYLYVDRKLEIKIKTLT